MQNYGAELHDQVCLVTGASRSLGADIARHFAAHGARMVLNYHRSEEAAMLLNDELNEMGVEVLTIQADVTAADDVQRLVESTLEQMGGIDILVNNVGPYVETPFIDLPPVEFDRIMAGNVGATYFLSREVGRLMQANGRGNIVNIAATDAFHRSHSVYGLAKQGVIYLTEAMALELAPHVRVNAIAPDLIADNEDMTAELVTKSLAGTPLPNLVTRAEIAEMTCLLCTSAFSSVTGHTLTMDGGRSIPRIQFD